MNKNFVAFLLIVLVAAVFFLAGKHASTPSGTVAKESTYERVLRTGEIRCAYAPNPPTLIKDPNTGIMSGIFSDVMNEAGQRLGLKIVWAEEVDYGTIAEGFSTDRYDAFCATVWPTAERSRVASFTVPLYYSPVGIFVRSGDHRKQFYGDTPLP